MGMLQWVALLIGGIGLLCCGRQAVAGERIAVADKAPFAATVGTGFTLNDWAAIAGIAIAVATFLLNWYYQQKRLEIERERLTFDLDDAS